MTQPAQPEPSAAASAPEPKPKPRKKKAAREGRVELAELWNRPLLLEPGRMDAIQALAVRGEAIEPEAFFFFEPPQPDIDNRDGVAVVHVSGGLWPWRMDRIRSQIDRALESSGVKGILLDVDSGGGSVAGTFDLADFIFEARERKPIWAIANEDAFSAAYAIASSAQRLHVTQTGGVGSVGVIARHVEFSKLDQRVGITYTAIFAGARKNDFTDTEPLNDTARSNMQAEVDRIREKIFGPAVARNRGMKLSAVLATEAGTFFGPEGVGIGFADAVSNFDETLAEFQASINRPRRGAAAGGQPVTTKGTDGNVVDLAAEKAKWQAESDAKTAEAVEAAKAESAKAATEVERQAQAARRSEITTLCTIGGCPDRIPEFLGSDISAEDVKKKLFEERQAKGGTAPEVDGKHGGGGQQPGAGAGGEAPKLKSTTELYRQRNQIGKGKG